MAKTNQPGPSEPKPPRQGTVDQAHANTLSPGAPQPLTVDHVYQVSEVPLSGSVRQVPQIPGYEIMGELGRGGMGVVYKAQHIQLKRVVALKVILAGGHASAAELSRFRTEAEAVARLRHPGIVQIFDIGEHDGLPYFSLEFCPGGSLAQRIHRGPPLRAKQAARLVEQLARAMQEAHEQNIVHRDLKPANVLLTDPAEGKPDKQRPLGKPKITDFGLAKRLDSSMVQTQTGAVMGTPSYMSPEQAAGKTRHIGPATDIYALGAILYELLTDRPPFTGATPLDIIKQVVSAEPVPPRQRRRGVPRDLEVICLKCLRKDPAQRYKTATELADDLRSYLNSEPISARAVGPLERSAKWLTRHALAVGLTAAFLVLLASLVVLWGKYSEGKRQRQELAERAAQLEETMRQAGFAGNRSDSPRPNLDKGNALAPAIPREPPPAPSGQVDRVKTMRQAGFAGNRSDSPRPNLDKGNTRGPFQDGQRPRSWIGARPNLGKGNKLAANVPLDKPPAIPRQDPPAPVGQVDRAKESQAVLQQLDVPLTAEGITTFLQEVGKGKHVLADAAADALIGQLGSDDFAIREMAVQKLAALPFPPRKKLQEAGKSRDLEIARRAREVLAKVENRPDPIDVALRSGQRLPEFRLSQEDLLALLPRCESLAAAEAAQDMLVAHLGPDDLPQVRQWLKDKSPGVQAAGIRALAAILKEKAEPELRTLLNSQQEMVRAAAVRALVRSGQVVDFHKHAAHLDPETQVMVLRLAEKQFRLDNADKRNDAQAMAEHQRLLDVYADALTKSKGVSRATKQPANTQHWMDQGLDTSKHPELLMYKIRWFNGNWSPWYVPGYNDREVGKGRDIRMWASFNDHEHEVITTTLKQKHRPVQDLP